jgi:hypothetical protein
VIWTKKGNEKSNNKADEKNPLYERTNNEARDKFIDKCVKELGCTVKDIKTKNKIVPIEKMLVYNNRPLCHCASRNGHLFTVGIRTINKGNEIRKLFNNSDVDKAFDDLKSLCGELDKIDTSSNKKTTPKELADSLIKRMKACTNSGGIHLPNEISGNESWFKKMVKEQNWTVDTKNRAISKGE